MDFTPGTDKLDFSGYGATEGSLTFIEAEDGLTVSFDFYGYIIAAKLYGVSALQDGDILYAA